MLLSEILEALRSPVNPRWIRTKKVYKNKKPVGQVEFISWYDLCDLLDDLCGNDGWEWLIADVKQVGDRLTLTGSLTIHGEDRSLTRQATGCEMLECSSYGDPTSNAEAMALRRCCAKFGLARDMWRRDGKPGRTATNTATAAPKQKGTITREQWLAMKAAK